MSSSQKSPAVAACDLVEKAVHSYLKPLGFTKHGRSLHRFVERDISQVITFQLGQAYTESTNLLWVNVGIRVPESMEMSFTPESPTKKYYHEYHCNIRSTLGLTEGKETTVYDLNTSLEHIIDDIIRQLRDCVLPVFEKLSSRDAILKYRMDYPEFDRMNRHLILREEAMIYGRRGDMESANIAYNRYLAELLDDIPSSTAPINPKLKSIAAEWLNYAISIASKNGIEIDEYNKLRIH